MLHAPAPHRHPSAPADPSPCSLLPLASQRRAVPRARSPQPPPLLPAPLRSALPHATCAASVVPAPACLACCCLRSAQAHPAIRRCPLPRCCCCSAAVPRSPAPTPVRAAPVRCRLAASRCRSGHPEPLSGRVPATLATPPVVGRRLTLLRGLARRGREPPPRPLAAVGSAPPHAFGLRPAPSTGRPVRPLAQ
nr:TANK-binding kinase 1-binding protein 1-like [Aegilops tauschii subsp. strangulata]